MKILTFHPGRYRNLPPRELLFSSKPDSLKMRGCSIRFLVGKNGTGKTNILRFIASIFIALEEDYRHPGPNNPAYTVPYLLSYELHGRKITISSSGKGRLGVSFKIGGDKIIRTQGEIPSHDLILPTNLLVYTSGDTRDWELLFNSGLLEQDEKEFVAVKRRFNDELPPNFSSLRRERFDTYASDLDIKPLTEIDESSLDEIRLKSKSRILLAKPQYLKLALLSAILDHNFHKRKISALNDALEEVNIRLLSFSLLLNLEEIPRDYRDRLELLNKLSTIQTRHWKDQLWVYDLNSIDVQSGKTTLERIDDNLLKSPFNFYQMLCDLQDDNVLQKVNLIIEYTPQKETEQPKRVLLSDDLSDGEFAFLSRMGLIYLLNEKECLFLLDEPEIHFNDDWKRNLVDSIERALTYPNKSASEVILTSHASIVITDAFPDEVILMTYSGQKASPRTLGGEPGELLQTVLGASQSVGKRASRMIQKALESNNENTLNKMLKQVGPGYFRFSIIEELQRVSLSKTNKLQSPK